MNHPDTNPHSHVLDVAASWKRERPDIDLDSLLFGIYVMRLGRVVDDAYDRMCRRRFGISGADMRVLFALRRAGKPYTRRPTDLFRALLVTSGAITKQVDRLSKLGFVERTEGNSQERNGILIELTSKGLRIANAAAEMLAQYSPLEPGLAGLSRSERATAYGLIEKVLVALEVNPVKQPPVKAGKAKRGTAQRPA